VNDDPGPDILALGFQELDLSTEALIYSLGSAKEDAWTMAITAALGEKAMDYEKVVSLDL
jgi:phosphatidylinositol-bisphosphatase